MTNSIEPWKLTAYALGELDAEETQHVRDAIEADPVLYAQLQEMQSFITRVQSAVQHAPPVDGLTVNQTSTIAECIQNATSQPVESQGTVVSIGDTVPPTTGSHARLSLPAVWGILALAASILVAILFIPLSRTTHRLASDFRTDDVSKLGYREESGESTSQTRTDPMQGLAASSEGRAMVPLEPAKTLPNLQASSAPEGDQDREFYAKGDPSDAPVNRLADQQSYVVENRREQAGAPGVQWADRYDNEKSNANPVQLSIAGGSGAAPTVPLGNIQVVENLVEQTDFGGNAPSSSTLSRPLDPNANEFILNARPRIIVAKEEVASESESINFYNDVTSLGRQAFGTGPSGDRYEPIIETPFVTTDKAPLSTFSIDVDTAAYSKVRQYLMQANQLPQPDAVRIEELINYFEYNYDEPTGEHPFASNMAVHTCPWNEEHKLVRIGLQAKKVDVRERAKANLVFLLDVSGSMDESNKLPLVKQAISMLVRQLGENDRIAMVVYAGAAGCVLPSITGDRQAQILAALEELNAGGSTNGGQGIELAYSIAREHFIPGGINRVILCTDGDFNVGTTSNEALVKLVQEQAKSKVFLTCLGFGIGNYNDSMMELISNQGNGVYGMVDNALEARRLMIEQLSGTLITVAKDVKIQVEFNPVKIASYRLIGYENRRLANEDFNNDKKDAGEIGAGHRVTALYEVVPVGVASKEPVVDELRYRVKKKAEPRTSDQGAREVRDREGSAFSDEWLTLKLRYKQPEADGSSKVEFFLTDEAAKLAADDNDFRWSSAVAEFGLLLRRSQLAPQADWGRMIERARSATGDNAYRIECLEMMTKAKSLIGR